MDINIEFLRCRIDSVAYCSNDYFDFIKVRQFSVTNSINKIVNGSLSNDGGLNWQILML